MRTEFEVGQIISRFKSSLSANIIPAAGFSRSSHVWNSAVPPLWEGMWMPVPSVESYVLVTTAAGTGIVPNARGQSVRYGYRHAKRICCP